MSKISDVEIYDRIRRMNIVYNGSLTKLDSISNPYPARLAISLFVVKQILIEMTDEEFIEKIKTAHVYEVDGGKFVNTSMKK